MLLRGAPKVGQSGLQPSFVEPTLAQRIFDKLSIGNNLPHQKIAFAISVQR